MKKKLPLGISDYKKIIEDNFYYLDKTLIIKEILDASEEIVLITRPRRFGKTLNLSTLRYFFEKTDVSNQRLFSDKAIWQTGKEYAGKQGQYPVIFLTFKDVKRCKRQ
ncbi:MAG: AAA family ATPase [Bacteroidia bacterium]|nr:AAA family ATPase [Bacteroidia bacterium]